MAASNGEGISTPRPPNGEKPKESQTHLLVDVDIDDVSLVNQHVDQRGLAMMQVTDNRDIPDRLQVRRQAHQEPARGATL